MMAASESMGTNEDRNPASPVALTPPLTSRVYPWTGSPPVSVGGVQETCAPRRPASKTKSALMVAGAAGVPDGTIGGLAVDQSLLPSRLARPYLERVAGAGVEAVQGQWAVDVVPDLGDGPFCSTCKDIPVTGVNSPVGTDQLTQSCPLAR